VVIEEQRDALIAQIRIDRVPTPEILKNAGYQAVNFFNISVVSFSFVLQG